MTDDSHPIIPPLEEPVAPSLKEQALEALNQADKGLMNEYEWQQGYNTIRRALESLSD